MGREAYWEMHNALQMKMERMGSVVLKESGPVNDMACMIYQAIGSEKTMMSIQWDLFSGSTEDGFLLTNIFFSTTDLMWPQIRKLPC